MSGRMTAGDWASLLIDQRYSLHCAIVDAIEAHAAAEVAAEVERCAKIVEGWHISKGGYTALAAAIRERGGKP